MLWSVALLAFAAANLEDVSERVRAEGEEDETATKKVSCWCDATKGVLAGRLDDAESDLRSLHPQVDGAIASNTRLRIEVADHQGAADEHAQSLAAATAIRDAAHERFTAEEADSSSALESLRLASDKVADLHAISFLQRSLRKQPSTSMVAGALKGLEDSFSSSLEAARADEVEQKSQFDSIAEAKSNMLKLEAAAAQRKQARIAESEAKLSRDKASIVGLEGRQEADQGLLAAVNQACAAVEDGAAARTKARNELVVELSKAVANQHQASAFRAFSLTQQDSDAAEMLSRLAADLTSVPASALAKAKALVASGDELGAAEQVEALRKDVTDKRESLLSKASNCRSGAKETEAEDSEAQASEQLTESDASDVKEGIAQTEAHAAALQDQLQKADAAASGLRSALSAAALLMNNVPSAIAEQSGDLSAIKAAAEALRSQAESDAQALQSGFAAVATAGQKCAKADMRVQVADLDNKAAASQALVDAEHAKRARKHSHVSLQACEAFDHEASVLDRDEKALSKAAADLSLGSMR